MAKIKFDNGVTVNFDGDPTQADIEEVASSFAPKRQFNTIAEAKAAMQQARQGQQIAELNASPVGLAGQVLGGAANAITGGGMSKLEDILAKRMNVPRFADKQNPAYNVGAGAGNMMVGAALAPVGGGLLGQIAAQTLGGAYSNPDNRLAGAAISGAGTAAVGVGGMAIKSVGDAVRSLSTRLSGTKSAQFADKIRTAFVNVKKNAVEKFGKGLDELSSKNPNKKIDIYENTAIGDILTDPNLPSEAKVIFNKTPILKDIISGDRASKVTLKEAQDIINYVQTKIPAQIKASHLDLPEFLSEMRIAQSNAFPKEMTTLRNEYAKIAQPFKDVKGQMRFNQLLGSIDRGFGGAEGKQAVKELFKDNPEILKEIGGYRKAGSLIKGALWASGLSGTYAVGKGILGKE